MIESEVHNCSSEDVDTIGKNGTYITRPEQDHDQLSRMIENTAISTDRNRTHRIHKVVVERLRKNSTLSLRYVKNEDRHPSDELVRTYLIDRTCHPYLKNRGNSLTVFEFKKLVYEERKREK